MNKIFFGLALLSVFSCNYAGEDVYMNPVDNAWNKNKRQVFRFQIEDAQTPKNIIFVVRNNNEYLYSNLRVFSVLKKEGQKAAKTDTLNYLLAKPNGAWIGSGFGDTKETLFQYKTNFRFPAPGTYTIEVQQAMRQDNLKGIEDFGVKIEQAQP